MKKRKKNKLKSSGRTQPKSLAVQPTEAQAKAAASATDSATLIKALADTGTGLWRLRQRMSQATASHSSPEMNRAQRQLEAIFDTLAAAQVEIRDHTGEAVPSSGIYALKALAYEPTPGLTSERVIETIKPSIYYDNRMIQMGEVIIGTLETSSESATHE